MKKSELTKKKVLHGALKVFEEKGFAAATTKEIAKAAQVAEGTIYKYFKSKEELLRAIALEFIEEMSEKLVVDRTRSIIEDYKEKPLEEKLKALILHRMALFEEHSSYMNVLMVEIRYDSHIRDIMVKEMIPKVGSMMNRTLEEAKEKGEIIDCDNVTLLRSFMGSIMMLYMQRQYIHLSGRDISMEKEVELIIELFMRGIRK